MANEQPVYHCALGDSALTLGVECIISYYRRLNPVLPLAQHQENANYYFK